MRGPRVLAVRALLRTVYSLVFSLKGDRKVVEVFYEFFVLLYGEHDVRLFPLLVDEVPNLDVAFDLHENT